MNDRKTNEQISGLLKGFDIKYGKALAPFIEWLLIELRRIGNRTIKQIIDAGWKLFDIQAKIKTAMVDTALEGATIKIKQMDKDAIINKRILGSDIKNIPWVDDGRDLNSRAQVADTATRKYILERVNADIGYARNFDQNLKKINASVRSSGVVDESMLRKRVRKMTSDIRKLGFTKSYELELKKLEAEISTLAEENYPTSQTKKAYESFIRAVRGQNIEAFEKSVDNMIKTKARYISRRIARTETARAQLDSFLLLSKDDNDVIAYKWNLDASHKITDVCDIHAKGDFGLGVGIFPKNKLPPIPAHPNCVCYLTEVIVDDEKPIKVSDFDYTKGGNAFLNKYPAKTQNVLLGSQERGKAFRKGKEWDKAIVGDPKPQSIESRFANAVKLKYL